MVFRNKNIRGRIGETKPMLQYIQNPMYQEEDGLIKIKNKWYIEIRTLKKCIGYFGSKSEVAKNLNCNYSSVYRCFRGLVSKVIVDKDAYLEFKDEIMEV